MENLSFKGSESGLLGPVKEDGHLQHEKQEFV